MAGGAGLAWERGSVARVHAWPSSSSKSPDSPKVSIAGRWPHSKVKKGLETSQVPEPALIRYCGTAALAWGLGAVQPGSQGPNCSHWECPPGAGQVWSQRVYSFQPLVRQSCSEARVPLGAQVCRPMPGPFCLLVLLPSVHSLQAQPIHSACAHNTP